MNEEFDYDADEKPSKSARKRQMTYLQQLGEQLLSLSPNHLAEMSISDQLRTAIEEGQRIKSREGLRRHKQFIGKVMRKEDTEDIERVLEKIRVGKTQRDAHFHQLEKWRDKLLTEGTNGIESAIQHFPHIDRQQLRQLLRQINSKTPDAKRAEISRKVFRYLREVSDID